MAAALLTIVGYALLIAGAGWVYPPAGLIVAGILFVALAALIDLSRDDKPAGDA